MDFLTEDDLMNLSNYIQLLSIIVINEIIDNITLILEYALQTSE